MQSPIVFERSGSVGIIELATPAKFNRLSTQAWQAIDAARAQAEADSSIRSLLIRAQGKNFCTGADLDEASTARLSAERLSDFLETGHRALLALEASPLPVVAAVQGLCLAGGLELALGADVVFAARSARFGDQHVQFGLAPGWGASQRLVRTIGLRRALDLMFSGKWLDADTAREQGLVNHVCADAELSAQALAYCETLGGRSRDSLAAMKDLARASLSVSPREALAAEVTRTVSVLMGENAAEGLAAFRERRPPSFR